MNTRQKGTDKEVLAASYLERHGVKVLEKNFRSHSGEVDLIGQDGDCLVFIEVKYRRSVNKGSALEAVDIRKQKQICKVADYYRFLHKIGAYSPMRYDVVAIQGESVIWVKNAFCHISRGLF